MDSLEYIDWQQLVIQILDDEQTGKVPIRPLGKVPIRPLGKGPIQPLGKDSIESAVNIPTNTLGVQSKPGNAKNKKQMLRPTVTSENNEIKVKDYIIILSNY